MNLKPQTLLFSFFFLLLIVFGNICETKDEFKVDSSFVST